MMKKLLILTCLILGFGLLNSSAQYSKLLDFTGPVAGGNGDDVWGNLVTDGTFLYGMTRQGGTTNDGLIFKILPDGTGYVKLMDFSATTTGSDPLGSFFYDGTFLYGMTSEGGTNGVGTIFKIFTNGTGFVKLLDFNQPVTGGRPEGSLIFDGTFLYGMTRVGGANNDGTIFRILPDGTGFQKTFDFTYSTNGASPRGTLFFDGTSLFGFTALGGANDFGTIFKILPDGGGFAKLLDFSGVATGGQPLNGQLISDGTFLYGMTFWSGATNNGTVFKILPDGTGFVKLLDFLGATNGARPQSGLTYDGKFLYGMTRLGGTGGIGTLFKIMPDGTGYSKLLDFSGSLNGREPYGSLMLDNGFLYGMTQYGGVNNQGVIFKYNVPPTITSFAPASGPIGTTVTIAGTNFSTTPANNIVYFGATRASVTAATSTQLTVIVPVGATYEPISVSVSGLTAHAPRPFVVTFTGGGFIDDCSFAPSVTIATVPGFTRPAFADIDGDGKPEMLIPESTSNQISIFRNISTAGSINASSFEPKVSFATVNTPFSVAVGDIDGDGKRDIAVINYNGFKISVFKNLSTPGTISLAPRVDYDIPNFGHDVSIADIDGDGKQDLTITTSLVGLTVLRNTGSPGVINASTFAAGIDFATGPNPNPFVLGDIDGDGKLDAAVPNANAHTVSLLRNTSSPGTVSFAPQVLLTIGPGTPTAGQGCVYTSLGDIDNDNKLDLIVTNNTFLSVTMYRNTSSTGSLSFDPKFDIITTNTFNTPRLDDLDGDGKIELITDNGTNSIAVYKNTATSGIINASSFNSLIAIPRAPSSALITGDVDGDGRNELISSSASLQVFQNLIGTISPPTITSFSPTVGLPGDFVIINGTNFNTNFGVNVNFNGIPAVILDFTGSSIQTEVPVGATTGPIEVTIGCNSVLSSSDFIVGAASCVPAIERNALIALYNATDGANWIDNTNWLSADESTWAGVSVTGCNVTGLFFQNNNLTGSLPVELGDLTELTTLSITLNPNLSGGIPVTLGNLSQLTTLQLWNNNLTGPIPTTLGNLNNLQRLELRNNQLTGNLPSTLGNIASLEYLQLDGNLLTGTIPTSFFGLTNLKTLELDANQLTGSISPSIAGLTNLESLGLSGNQLSGTLPTELGSLIKLTRLQLAVNQFSGNLPTSIGNLINLTSFSVFNNQLTGTVPSTLANLVNLTGLGLSVNQFTGDVPAGIGLIPNLSDVSVRDNDFTSIPTFVSTSFTDLLVYGNKLHFGHLEPNIGKGGFVYAPQDNLPGGVASACEGSSLTINFSTPGTANQYQWYKDGSPIAGANSANFSKSNATASDAGNYTVQVTNTIVTGLTLTSGAFNVSIEQAPCSNQPPVIASTASGSQIEGMVTIALLPLISDPDGNLDLSTLSVVGGTSEEGALASINASSELVLDYSGVLFTGIDYVTIEVCDLFGVCVQQELEIEVIGDIVVFNALSPNPGDNLNSVFVIQYIDVFTDTEKNRVTIYNRWGDVVWEGTDYDNASVVFEGTSTNGKELPSGTYFYKIEFTSGRELKTGFLSLKR